MKWSSKKPDNEGWWWFRWNGCKRGEPVYVRRRGRCLLARGSYIGVTTGVSTLKGRGQWAGPIAEPEEA